MAILVRGTHPPPLPPPATISRTGPTEQESVFEGVDAELLHSQDYVQLP